MRRSPTAECCRPIGVNSCVSDCFCVFKTVYSLLTRGWNKASYGIQTSTSLQITASNATIHFMEGDAQAQTPRSKNCAVITLSSLWNLTAPECDGLLNPRPAVFLITAESPPGKYAQSPSPPSYTRTIPTFSLWVLDSLNTQSTMPITHLLTTNNPYDVLSR